MASRASAQATTAATGAGKVRVIAVACSSRKGKTTAAALDVCLKAARDANPDRVETELIDLGGLAIPVFDPAAKPDPASDFSRIAARLSDPATAALIVGTPVYFCSMSSLCKAFLDHLMMFRRTFALRNKVAGALAVGAARNGGQELTLQGVQAALLCQEMIIVGDAAPSGRLGAMLLNDGKDDITGDEPGLASARNLGRRVAEVALQVRART